MGENVTKLPVRTNKRSSSLCHSYGNPSKVSVEKWIDYLRISAAAFGSPLVGRFLRRHRYGGVK